MAQNIPPNTQPPSQSRKDQANVNPPPPATRPELPRMPAPPSNKQG